MSALDLSEVADGVLLRVRVRPGGPKNALGPVHDGALKLTVTAAPERGKANLAVVRLLARHLGCPRSALRILSGETHRDKVVLVEGVGGDEVQRRLAPIDPRSA